MIGLGPDASVAPARSQVCTARRAGETSTRSGTRSARVSQSPVAAAGRAPRSVSGRSVSTGPSAALAWRTRRSRRVCTGRVWHSPCEAHSRLVCRSGHYGTVPPQPTGAGFGFFVCRPRRAWSPSRGGDSSAGNPGSPADSHAADGALSLVGHGSLGHGVGMAMGYPPFTALAAVHRGGSQGVGTRLTVDGRRGVLEASRVGHAAHHVVRQRLERIRRAVGEGLPERGEELVEFRLPRGGSPPPHPP